MNKNMPPYKTLDRFITLNHFLRILFFPYSKTFKIAKKYCMQVKLRNILLYHCPIAKACCNIISGFIEEAGNQYR